MFESDVAIWVLEDIFFEEEDDRLHSLRVSVGLYQHYHSMEHLDQDQHCWHIEDRSAVFEAA